MMSSPSELSFLSSDIGMDSSYPQFTHDPEFSDMMSSYMKINDFSLNPMMTQTLPISMMNGTPLSPESDNGSFTDSVISSNSSQQPSQQHSDHEYHTQHVDEPLSPLPDDYFINMATLQAQQQPVQQQPPPPQQQQQQDVKPMILHTTPPTTPTEVKPTPITPTSTSSSIDSKPTKKPRKSKVKPEPVEEPIDDDVDIEIDPNLPPDMIRELLQEQNLKKKRLARKAELARMSRKRKKTRMGDLEQECERLHAEIDRLRKMRRLDMDETNPKQQQPPQAAKPASTMNMIQEEDGKFVFDSRRWIDVSDHQKLVNDSIQAMADAARTPQGQDDPVYMGKLHETFVNHFNRQLVASEGHIAALENHLSPCMPLQFLQWVMSQPDKFIQDGSGLWNSLFQAEIGVSVDQMKEIMALRTTVKKQRKVTVDVEKAYKKLSHSLRRQMLQSNENLTKLRSILSPLQVAKYFDWVNRFGHVCVKINL